MAFTATYFGSSGWFLKIGNLKILIDPWLKGTLTFPLGSWFFEGKLQKHINPPEQIDLLMLTQGLADHTHRPTLENLPRSIPVVASHSAARVVREIGFKFVFEMEPGEIKSFRDMEIEATSGAAIPKVENGYILSHQCGSLYIEPHGFLDSKIKPRNIDAVISPVINLKLPFGGNFINGKDIFPDLIEMFTPLTLLASTTGGDAVFSGFINNLISIDGTIHEAAEHLGNKLVFIDPIPGHCYNLKTRNYSH